MELVTQLDEATIEAVAKRCGRAIGAVRDPAYNPWPGDRDHARFFVMRCMSIGDWIGSAETAAYEIRDPGARERAATLVRLVHSWCKEHAADELNRLYRQRPPRKPRAAAVRHA